MADSERVELSKDIPALNGFQDRARRQLSGGLSVEDKVGFEPTMCFRKRIKSPPPSTY